MGLDHHPDGAPRAHPADLGAQLFFNDILKHLIDGKANVRARTRGHENPRFGMNRPALRVALDADAAHAPAHVLLVGLLHAVHARIIHANEADQRGCEFTLGVKTPALGNEAEAVDPQFFDSSFLIRIDFPLEPHISAAAFQFFEIIFRRAAQDFLERQRSVPGVGHLPGVGEKRGRVDAHRQRPAPHVHDVPSPGTHHERAAQLALCVGHEAVAVADLDDGELDAQHAESKNHQGAANHQATREALLHGSTCYGR